MKRTLLLAAAALAASLAQAHRGGSYAALVQHRIEHPEQVEVEVVHIHASD